jgi:hypothetical protein
VPRNALNPPETPPGLAPGGRKLWREVAKSHRLRPDQRRILFEACCEVDLIDRLQADLGSTPTTTKGSMGQEVAHPTLSELRQHRMAVNTLIRALALEATDTSAADASKAAREAGTALARQKYKRQGLRAI